jgi:50S ribosomal subunit-associated GTPase HflX
MREKIIDYRKGKIKGSIKFYHYRGIGFGFLAEGNEKIESYSRRFKAKIPYDLGKEFKTLNSAKKFMEKHGYKEVKGGKK